MMAAFTAHEVTNALPWELRVYDGHLSTSQGLRVREAQLITGQRGHLQRRWQSFTNTYTRETRSHTNVWMPVGHTNNWRLNSNVISLKNFWNIPNHKSKIAAHMMWPAHPQWAMIDQWRTSSPNSAIPTNNFTGLNKHSTGLFSHNNLQAIVTELTPQTGNLSIGYKIAVNFSKTTCFVPCD